MKKDCNQLMTKPQIRFKVVLTMFSRKSKPFGYVCPPLHRSIQKKNSFDSQAIILRSHFETRRRSRMDRASLIFRVITLYSVGLSTVVWGSEPYVGNYIKVQKAYVCPHYFCFIFFFYAFMKVDSFVMPNVIIFLNFTNSFSTFWWEWLYVKYLVHFFLAIFFSL